MTVATATQTLEERVEGWANDLCAALEENFKQETIRSHKRQRDEGDSWSKEYHQDRLDEIALGGGHLYKFAAYKGCLLYTSPSPRDVEESRMPSSA